MNELSSILHASMFLTTCNQRKEVGSYLRFIDHVSTGVSDSLLLCANVPLLYVNLSCDKKSSLIPDTKSIK